VSPMQVAKDAARSIANVAAKAVADVVAKSVAKSIVNIVDETVAKSMAEIIAEIIHEEIAEGVHEYVVELFENEAVDKSLDIFEMIDKKVGEIVHTIIDEVIRDDEDIINEIVTNAVTKADEQADKQVVEHIHDSINEAVVGSIDVAEKTAVDAAKKAAPKAKKAAAKTRKAAAEEVAKNKADENAIENLSKQFALKMLEIHPASHFNILEKITTKDDIKLIEQTLELITNKQPNAKSVIEHLHTHLGGKYAFVHVIYYMMMFVNKRILNNSKQIRNNTNLQELVNEFKKFCENNGGDAIQRAVKKGETLNFWAFFKNAIVTRTSFIWKDMTRHKIPISR